MNIVLSVVGILAAILWVVCNLITAKTLSGKEMKQGFVQGQCLVGKIFANIFYAPAWILKGVRFVVLSTIK